MAAGLFKTGQKQGVLLTVTAHRWLTSLFSYLYMMSLAEATCVLHTWTSVVNV